jgi:hypothetical protein
MTELIAEELNAIPELPQKLADLGVSRHPAFANVAAARSALDSAYLSCEVLD